MTRALPLNAFNEHLTIRFLNPTASRALTILHTIYLPPKKTIKLFQPSYLDVGGLKKFERCEAYLKDGL